MSRRPWERRRMQRSPTVVVSRGHICAILNEQFNQIDVSRIAMPNAKESNRRYHERLHLHRVE